MNRTVLVVDDDDALRTSLCDALVDEGYLAIGAANGQEALDYLRGAESPPCLVLLDLMMPVMNGWQFREVQRQDARLSAIPVVVVTANNRVSRDEIDADDVVWKPLRLDTLLETAHRYCPC